MRNFLLLLAVVCLGITKTAYSQTDITIGTGTATNTTTGYPCPMQDRYEGSRMQYLYRASELQTAGMAAGNINAIKYTVTSLGSFSGIVDGQTIKIGTTTLNTLDAATWVTVSSTVYGPVDYVPVVGVNTFTFSAPFFWNGTDNIIIEVCNGSPNAVAATTWTNNPLVTLTSGLSFNGSHSFRVDGINGPLCTTTTTTNTGNLTDRPNIIFNWTPAAACAGVPNPGTATATSNACGLNVALNSTGVTVASGLTYQWEVDNGSGFNALAGANTISASTTQTVTSTYRLKVTCTNTGDFNYSNQVTVTTPPLPSGTYTIDFGNSTTWPGAGAASNFKTFNDAYNAMKCGIAGAVTFNVVANSGPYNEQLIMTAIPNANASRTVTFNGNGNTITFNTINANERAVIKLKGAEYIRFDSLIITSTGTTYGYGVQLTADADSNIIRRCTVNVSGTSTSTNFAGIVISGSETDAIGLGTTTAVCDFNEITNNTINGGYYGLTLTATFAGGAHGYNKFKGNTIQNFHQYGIYVAGTYSTIIDSNYITRPTRATVSATSFEGIYFTTQSNNCRITRNRIFNPYGGLAATTTIPFNGINFTTASASATNDNWVANNVIANITGNGQQNGFTNNASNNVWYLHNTISLDNSVSTAGVTRGLNLTAAAGGILFYDNIVSITRGGTAAKHAIYLAANILGADYNDYYVNSPGGNNIGFLVSTSYTTLPTWRVGSGQDQNSWATNPVFANPSHIDTGYKPTNQAINDRGLYIGIDNDILGVVRSTSTPDIGAYEFTPPPCSVPPVNGTTVVSPTTVCQGSTVQLNATMSGAYGSGQTFQWQVSSTGAAGAYSNVGPALASPDYNIVASSYGTFHYQLEISCGTSQVYSNPVQLTVNPALPQGSYTIDQINPLGTTYTIAAPSAGANFANFNAVKTALATCGINGPVVFNVVTATGPYIEQITFDSVRNASASNTLTFNGSGETLTWASTNSNERATLKLNKADFFTFDNLVIEATGSTYAYGVQLVSDADTNAIRNCIINVPKLTVGNANINGVVINATATGVIATGITRCDGNIFENNSITGGYYGATLVGSATELINNNRFVGNAIQDFFLTGMYIGGTNNTLVEGNIFSRPTLTATGTVTGINMAGALNNSLSISKNRFNHFMQSVTTGANSAQYIIYHNNVNAAAGSENIVSNNLIHDLEGTGIIYALYNNTSAGVYYYHNTISLDYTATPATGETRAFFQTGAATGLEFKDNMIAIRRAGSAAKYGLYFGTTTNTIVSNYNNIYVPGTAANVGVGFYNAPRQTLGAWQQNSLQDANSLSLDPVFQSNFAPGIITLDDKGTPVGIFTDLLGNARSATTPDIGAIEFVAPPCISPAVGGTASVTPGSNICLQEPITLDLTGATPVGTTQYIWQSSPSGLPGTWTNISPVLYGPQYNTVTTPNTYFRAVVSCSGTSDTSTITQVILNSVVFEGTYTINSNLATDWPGAPPRNFNSFTDAVNAMQCGITGPVVFKVLAGASAGVYNEQIRINNIRNSSAQNTITFESDNGNPASVNLTYNSTLPGTNYTLKLDSTIYTTFRNITISATNTTYGRAVELASTASNNKFIGCNIVAPAGTFTGNTVAGVYANQLKGTNDTLKQNTITGGAAGIYFFGTNATNLTVDHIIDSNIVSNAYVQGIYANYHKRLKIRGNTVNVNGPVSGTAYGIFASDCDSSFVVNDNKINISNAASLVYGININNSDGDNTAAQRSQVMRNVITATNNNTGALHGLYLNNSSNHDAWNNVIAVSTTSLTSYGINNQNSGLSKYYNNSVNNSSAAGVTTSAAAWFNNSSTTAYTLRNNIFSNKGTGRAVILYNGAQSGLSDYNMFYTAGATLIASTAPAGNYANIATWRTASFQDKYSIVYNPTFVSNTDLHPDGANADVWAMHGRGVQIVGNDKDVNGNFRPTTLTQGVPDLGAYEFLPTSQPTVLNGVPTTPTANGTQYFMYGTDTVMKIKWPASATNIPSSINIQRYSGVPPGDHPYPNSIDSMFFWVKVNVPGSVPNNYQADAIQLFYLDPWQGSIPAQYMIGLGRKDPVLNTWMVNFTSRTNPATKVTIDSFITNIDKFTGFINPYAPPVLPDKDSSNRGRRFWVAYGHHQQMSGAGGGGQEMRLYLSAQQPANVQVAINGTNWVRNYSIPANTAIISDLIPKTGPEDARILDEGLWTKGISITSDEPIEAYAHIYATTNSGASLLLPVGVYAYEYYSMNSSQYYASDCYSWVYVLADKDNTQVEITPSVTTKGGRPANVPFQVTLNRGELYMVMGTTSGATGTDVSGTLIKSVANSVGECHPIAVFSGSSRTAICNTTNGDNYNQQVFPYSAWGKRYATFSSANNTSTTQYNSNIYRVMVKDPTTVVTVNGTSVTAAPWNATFNGRFYQFGTPAGNGTSAAIYIEADKPVMVGQFMMSSGGTGCPGFTAPGDGDPEMMYISPIEQGINKAVFYTTIQNTINTNYINVVVPSGGTGFSSLKIDGSSTFTHVFDHPALPGYKCIRHNLPAVNGQHVIQGDSAFTAITYGLGGAESYGYNTGTLVKTLTAKVASNITGGQSGLPYVCAGTPFTFTVYLPISPTKVTFKMGATPNVAPNTDTTYLNPVPVGTTYINNTLHYIFNFTRSHIFSVPGLYTFTLEYEHPDIEACDHKGVDLINVVVRPAPKPNAFTINFPGCEGDVATITSGITTPNNIPISTWNWTLPNGTTATGSNTNYTFSTAGTYTVSLHTATSEGCFADTSKTVTVNPLPVVDVVSSAIAVCNGADTVLKVQSPVSGVTYNWYTNSIGGIPVATGSTFTLTSITAAATYYVEAVSAQGCISATRKQVDITILQPLTAPVISSSPVSTANSITFNWNAVTGATGYLVSVNGGLYITPSSGATGLSHTVNGLSTLASACIEVKALGTIACQDAVSSQVCGCANSSAAVVLNAISVCNGAAATFNIASPAAGVTYNWFTTSTGGVALANGGAYTINATGSVFTVNNVTSSQQFWVEQSAGSCVGSPRTQVDVTVLIPLVQAVPTFTSATANTVTFSWPAVAGATGYEVSVNGGTYVPANGTLSHTASGLTTLQSVCITVRALGSNACQNSVSASVCGCPNSSAVVTNASVNVCTGTTATFNIQSPVAGVTYNWYNALTGGTLVGTGSSFTTPSVSANTSYYVEQVGSGGCIGTPRTLVTATILPPLAQPVITATPGNITPTQITFTWSLVAGAVGYEVSTVGASGPWITPSSGSTGLSHTVTGLTPNQSVTLWVRALGTIACQNSQASLQAITTPDQIFIPNTFTPNGDGKNDVLMAYGYAIQSIQFMVFNQWGEKIHDISSTSQNAQGGFIIWDGKSKGKIQPIGVYVYTAKIVLKDGTVIEKSGALNIVR